MKYNKTFKIMQISVLLLFILNLTSLKCFCQIFDSEQNPLSVKWKEINSQGFQIIYPTELEIVSQRMANTLGKIYPMIGSSLNRQKTTIPIVFQNRGVLANGFVQLAPKKSQFNTTPPQQFDSQDWLNNLAVHELRHVAQYDRFTNGKSLFLSEEIHFAYMGISMPTWFFEGDAVSIETALTNAGRGRQPSWIMPFRTSLLNGNKISYSKAYFGSQKDQTPGYYQLGYLITSKLRNDYGKKIVDSLIHQISTHPIRLYPFSQTLKNIVGSNTKNFYKSTVDELKKEWKIQDKKNKSIDYISLNQPSTFSTSYFLPIEISENRILAIKQSKTDAPFFVTIDSNQSEKRLFGIAYQEQPWFSYANDVIVWDEIRFDPRYKQRTYSVICSYNLKTEEMRQLTFKSRLFSPSFSADGKKLIAVQIDLSNTSNIVSIDPKNGKILHTYPNPKNLTLQTPTLNTNGTQLAYVSVSEKGKSLWLINKDGKSTKLIFETNQQISKPAFINEQIAFNAHYSGIDNIYAVNPSSKKITALTASKYGAFNVSLSANKKSIIFNNYQLMGYEIAKSSILNKEIQKNNFIFFGNAAELQENTENIFDKISDSTFISKPYYPSAHLLNFHSISPDLNENNRIGLKLKSTDLLNNLDFNAGLNYDNDLKKMEYNAGVNYKSLFPIINVNYNNRARKAFYINKDIVNEANWRENYISINASVPLSFNKYNQNFSLLANLGTSYTIRDFDPKEISIYAKKIAFPMIYELSIGHSVRASERDLGPKWAQNISISYQHRPFSDNGGKLLAFSSNFFFPGLAKNHSLNTSFNFQQNTGVFNGNNNISTVYGYNQIKATKNLKNTLLINYKFPLLYPDAEIGSFAYIRNIRGGIFSHYENLGKETNLTQPKTFGLELRSSINLLRYQPIVDVGARIIFVNKKYEQKPILDLIFNYSF